MASCCVTAVTPGVLAARSITSAIPNVPLLSYTSSVAAPNRPGDLSRWRRDESSVATTRTAATATAMLAAAAPARARERRPDPAGSVAKDAPSDIAGRPRSRPESRPLLAARAGRVPEAAAATSTSTSDAATSVSPAPAASVDTSQRSPGSGSARAAAPRGNRPLAAQATNGTASAPAAMATLAIATDPDVRCGRVRPIAVSAGWSAAEAATRRPSAWATRRRPPSAATAVAIHSVDTPTSMLGTIAAPGPVVVVVTWSPYGATISSTSAAMASRWSGSTRR